MQILSRIIHGRLVRGHRPQPSGATLPVVNTCLSKDPAITLISLKIPFLGTCRLFIRFLYTYLSRQSDQHDDGSVETESNHVRAVHFWGEMLQFRTAHPKNSANIEIHRQVLIFEDFTG
jgi:hypothetical protein